MRAITPWTAGTVRGPLRDGCRVAPVEYHRAYCMLRSLQIFRTIIRTRDVDHTNCVAAVSSLTGSGKKLFAHVANS